MHSFPALGRLRLELWVKNVEPGEVSPAPSKASKSAYDLGPYFHVTYLSGSRRR